MKQGDRDYLRNEQNLGWAIDSAISKLTISARPGRDSLEEWEKIKAAADALSKRAEEGIAEHSALPAYNGLTMSAAEYVSDQERRAGHCSSERYKRPPPCR
ncbi:MAG: hypothetical protein Q8P56_00960 [Candidatus Uhrbacteria bacterium]|nr:hypothetical protein [Candidatus Uhrbacteria bacterium]